MSTVDHRNADPQQATLSDQHALEWTRAVEDAQRAVAAMPDAYEVAGWLNFKQVGALYRTFASRGAWRLTDEDATDADLVRSLRLCGLVEMRGPFLTAHGMSVRRVIREPVL